MFIKDLFLPQRKEKLGIDGYRFLKTAQIFLNDIRNSIEVDVFI